MRWMFLFFLFAMGLLWANAERENIFFEPANSKMIGEGISNAEGVIRFWKKIGNGAEWEFEVKEAGQYYLYFKISSPAHEGGKAVLNVDGEDLTVWEIPSTLGFNDFQVFRVKELPLEVGKHKLQLLCKELKKESLFDVKRGVLATEDNPDVLKSEEEKQKQRMEEALKKARDFPTALVTANQFFMETIEKENKKRIYAYLEEHFPYQMDWLFQDTGEKVNPFLENKMESRLLAELVGKVFSKISGGENLRKEYEEIKKKQEVSAEGWLVLYEKACWARRQQRLGILHKEAPKLIFTKHHIFGSTNYIYLLTESEGTSQRSSLCTLDLNEEKEGKFAQPRLLIDPGEGSVRDPELSFDGKKLLFAMRRSRNHFSSCRLYRHYAFYCPAPDQNNYVKTALGSDESNYQIYELDMETKALRSLTSNETYGSSFEPCYLPNGDIMFNSARIVQHITCGWGDCSNLFIMNKEGRYARRVGFDQTNTAFPALLNDGRVIFTRRDYNDRGQTSAHALFQMNSDGSGQTEFYGNQTGLPNSLQHARSIPGSSKVITILGGYHTTQGGKLALLDVNLGRQKDQGLVLIPGYKKPKTGEGHDDGYGKDGVQYSNPYALTEKDYLVSISPYNGAHYGLYYMNDLGERELLAKDAGTSCLQVIPQRARPVPTHRPTFLDYTKDDGVFYVQNVYYGTAAEGINPGSIRKLRVVEILYKNATIGSAMGQGPGGNWDTILPTGNGLASFDSKSILGDATVYEDGSAMFKVPARKPVYFQLLDENNRVVQTMRSWATLMPNEKFSCVGCHEDKNEAPLSDNRKTIAFTKGAEKLTPFYGPARAFSFIYEVQPVFDKHCISCHSEKGEAKKLVLTAEPYVDDHRAMRRFYRSYYQLTVARPENAHQPEDFAYWADDPVWGPGRERGKRLPDEPNRYVSWYTRFELMRPYPPYRAGSIRSGLVKTLEKGHKSVKLSGEELDKIRAWIDLNIPFAGEYDESNLWSDAEKAFYRARVDERRRNEKIEERHIREFIENSR